MTTNFEVNQTIADHLQQIAHLFGKNKDVWRSKAFSNASSVFRIRHESIEVKSGLVLPRIKGVGKAVNDVIVEFLESGTSKKLEKLKTQFPNEVLERFDAVICKRKVTELLKPLTDAGVDWGYAGSMRRGSATVKDVDVIICLKDEAVERALVKKVLEDAGLTPDVRNGEVKVGVSIPIKNQGRSFTLDLNFTYPECRGAHYLYFTGPKVFNINQRGQAKEKGLRLNQKGLFDANGKLIAGATEEEIFAALGQIYIEPTKRA